MKKVSENGKRNVFMVGDFNLNSSYGESGKVNYWVKLKRAFPGSKLYNSSPSSLSEKDKLANDYDHFILNPEKNQNCVSEESTEPGQIDIKTFDFMDEESYRDLKFSSWDKLIEPYIKPSSAKKKELIADFKERVEQRSYYKGKTVNTIDYAPFSSFKGIFRDCRKNGKQTAMDAVSAYIKGFDCSLFYSQKNPDKKWKVFKSLISDHIPVVLTCNID